ncbi:hypothetical protein QE152_g6353 [Popillia japonica]|uniref:Uncharacterized protein n=1 Tax=Popillia japonica TaxID=7064 RepID=A0AAW1MIL1_POPJA
MTYGSELCLILVLIMKTYDSLSSYQQLLLKCSAVIGEMIPRDMLNYVMNQKNPRMTARAVQKLFEIRVLSCARGDFTQGDACVSFDMRLVNPNKDTAIKCDCKGIRIHETCLDLPKYASCGYFRFRLGAFRETTYNLLTDSQRKEFHGRAVRYLEKETRKCKACGNAFFVRILGVRYDEGMKKKLKLQRASRKAQRSATNNMDLQKKTSQYSAATSSTGSPSRSQNVNISTGGDSKYSAVKKGSSDMLKQNCIAVTTIKRLFQLPMSPDLSFDVQSISYADFSNCQCPQILASMYNQLIEHCEGSDLKDKLMDAMLEYAYLCIISYNIPQAIKILNRALTFLETQVTADIDDGTEWKIPLIRAKIEALFGRCKVELGEIAEAQQLFMKAMTDYGLPFPTSQISTSIIIRRLQMQQTMTLFCRPINVGIKQGYEAEFCDDVSDCLALMCNLFIERNMWKQAKLAAVWSLNKALHSDMDFFILCNAYANMIQVAHHYGMQQICIALEVHALRLCHRKKTNVEPQELKDMDFFILCNAYANMIQVAHHYGMQQICIALEVHALRLCHRKKTNVEPQELKGICIALEVHALRLCHRKKTNVEPQELKGVAKLYGTIFCARFLRSEIEHAIELGFVMLRISSTIHAVTYSLQAMPILIQALIMRKRIMEAVTVLFELEYFAEEDIDNSGRTWYYALCIGIHLETGYTVIPYNQCERLYHIEGETMSTVRDPDAEKRYFTVMWLWSVRNDDWESATIWHSKIKNFSIGGGDQDSIANIFTALYLLEALLVFMVGKMDRRNIEAMSNAYHEIGILMNTLEKTLKVVKAIAPRFYHLKAYYKFYHLKAYYKYIRYEENTAMTFLRKARNNAIKNENLLEESWLEHSEKAWTNSLSAVNADFWTEHCDPNNIIDYHEIDANNGRIGHYTLPTPLYI